MMRSFTPPSRSKNPMASNLGFSSSNSSACTSTESLTAATTPVRPDNPMASSLEFLASNGDFDFDIPSPFRTQEESQVVVDIGFVYGKDGEIMIPATPNNTRADNSKKLERQDSYDFDTESFYESIALTPFVQRNMTELAMMADAHPNVIANLYGLNPNQHFSPIHKCPPKSTTSRRKVQFVQPIRPLLRRVPGALVKIRNSSKATPNARSPIFVQTNHPSTSPTPNNTPIGSDGSAFSLVQNHRAFRSPATGFYPKITDLSSPTSSHPSGNTPVITHANNFGSCFDTPHPTKGRKGLDLAYTPVPSITMESVSEQLVFSPITTTDAQPEVEPEVVPQEWIELYHTRPSTNDATGRMKTWIRKVLRFRKGPAASHTNDDGDSGKEEKDDGADPKSAFVDVYLHHEPEKDNGNV